MDFEQADALNGAIRTICIRHRAQAAAFLARLGLHPGQETIILLLEAHGTQTQVQLAAGAGCEPPSITGMVRKLESAGLISRRPSARDGRATEVALTSEGRAIIPELKALWMELAEQTVATFSSIPNDQLIAVLDELGRSLRQHGEEKGLSIKSR